MKKLCELDCNYKFLSPLTLAFVGDAVYDLFLREQLVCKSNYKIDKLHKIKVSKACCLAQSEIVNKIIPSLSEEELSIYKRGRNAHTHHTPKNASNKDYHNATGFEALIGYIYLKNDINRLKQLFSIIENLYN